MSLTTEMTSVFTKYNSSPEIQKDMLLLVDMTGQELLKAWKKKVVIKPAAKPQSTFSHIISQAPVELRDDLFNTWELLFDAAGTIATNTVQQSGESSGNLGECIEFLVESHKMPLEQKFPEHIPAILKALYLLATLCLFDAVAVIVKVQQTAKAA